MRSTFVTHARCCFWILALEGLRECFDLLTSRGFVFGVNDGSQVGVNLRLMFIGNLIKDVPNLMQPAALLLRV